MMVFWLKTIIRAFLKYSLWVAIVQDQKSILSFINRVQMKLYHNNRIKRLSLVSKY